MKVQIDTKQKTVSILDNINIKELVKALKVMLGDEFGEYSINATEKVWWYYYPTVTWTTGDPLITTTGTTVYNVDIVN